MENVLKFPAAPANGGEIDCTVMEAADDFQVDMLDLHALETQAFQNLKRVIAAFEATVGQFPNSKQKIKAQQYIERSYEILTTCNKLRYQEKLTIKDDNPSKSKMNKEDMLILLRLIREIDRVSYSLIELLIEFDAHHDR